jgi:hypothetical protein
MPTPIAALDPRRGRPRKFEAPSKAVTLTLPNTAIAALADIDPDISRAVVSLIQSVIPREPQAPAELATFGKSAVIVVRPTPALEERTGVKLIPLSCGGALISFGEAVNVARLELSIRDALEDPALTERDRAIFAGVADILKSSRRSRNVELRQRNVIVLEHTGPHRRRSAKREQQTADRATTS